MFGNIKKLIVENKKTFLGFLIMITSVIVIFGYFIFKDDEKKEVVVSDVKQEVVVKSVKTPAMPNYGSYLQEKSSTDFILIILILLFFIGIFIIISSKEKKWKKLYLWLLLRFLF